MLSVGRIIERKPVKVFSFKTCLVEEHFEMVHYVVPGEKPRWGYFPTDGHPNVVTKFEGTKATPEFLQAVAYHSVISTVKLHGMSCWDYLGKFFKNIFNGCRDFLSLMPANIDMAYANC